MEVFPPGTGPVARADKATCTTCCHGAGEGAAKDQSPWLMRTPSWTGGATQLLCGNCHGIPPVDENHMPATQLGPQ